MKIALIGYEANIKNRVGSNQYAYELIKTLYQLDGKNQYSVFLPTAPLADMPKQRKNWEYRVVGPTKFWNIFGLPKELYRKKPFPEVVFNPGHYCPLFFPAPLVVSVMDLGYLHFPEHFTRPIFLKLKLWTQLSVKQATHIFAISNSTKNDIIKYYKIKPEKITVTYPGYDKEKFENQKSKVKIEEVKKKYKIAGDYLLFLGTLKPNKNIEGLIEAFELLGDRNLQLVIAGRKGWLYQTIFARVKELKLEKKVVFTDFVDEKDLPVLMRQAKVFVLPSFWEGFGIPVIEAMACGTPVVVSNAGSLPEIVAKAGVIIDPDNPEDIAQGLKEALKKGKELSQKGIEQAKKFDWQDCAQKTLAVLESIK